MTETDILTMNLADAIIERPYPIDVDGVRLYLYPPTLGKTIILDRHISAVGFDLQLAKANPYMEALRACSEHREAVSGILAIHTCRSKDEVMDEAFVKERAKQISDAASDEDLATLLVLVMTRFSPEPFIEHLGLDKERQEMQRVQKCKESKNTYTFGGRSMYGTVIDYACEKYGWTFEYVVWGVSYINIKMLMADAVQHIFLTDEEQKRCHVLKRDGEVINGDDPDSVNRLAEILKE